MGARARLIDVAQAAGVSRVAVGKVLLGTGGERVCVAERTASKIRAAARRLGYRPNLTAQQLRGMPSRLISVVMSVGAPAVELDRLVQLEKLACASGFQLAVSATPEGNPREGVQRVVDSMAARARP
jgi:LacI family repressor for deo operon, udp, cdd, tsx, nupC, and nupG